MRILCVLLLLTALPVFAQKQDFLLETPAEREARMAWWEQGRFGLFLHWGLYAVPAGEYGGQKNYGEWLMYEAKIPVPEYEKLAEQFNPFQFDANAWVRLARDAGMKYIVITTKHHDGFCMFDSKVSDYDIVDRTPFHRDPIRELAQACRKARIKLCFYHSIMDWHHPDAKGDRFPVYRDEYLKPQLKELLTQYGDIGVLWFDGEWIDEWTEPQGRDLYNYVRGLQPHIIVNNRVGKGRNGMQGMDNGAGSAGDFGTPEQEILTEKSGLPWESCMTMNDHWGYNRNDKNFKSPADIIWNLSDIVAKGGNYLLNVGPTEEGLFPQECIDTLRATGVWTHRNAEAVYGTQPWKYWQEGPDIRYAEGRAGAVFAFVRKLAGPTLTLKKMQVTPNTLLTILGEEKPLAWRQSEDGLVIDLPPTLDLKTQPVWVFKMYGQPADVSNAPVISAGGNAPGQGAQHTFVYKGKTTVAISAEPGATVWYTTDGSEPNAQSKVYGKPLKLDSSAVIRAIARMPGKVSSETTVMSFVRSNVGITLETPYAEKYAASGVMSLRDQAFGSLKFTDGRWLGFEGNDFVATLDLGKKQKVSAVGGSFLRLIPSWIFLPTAVEIYASNNGKTFTKVAEQVLIPASDADKNERTSVVLKFSAKCRYIRLVAKNQGVCPAWHPGAGAKAWLFTDEIWVDAK